MPTATLIRYDLDPTGQNPDNKVSGEIKTLSTAQLRAACPTYGPFFASSIVIYDHGTNRLLVRGVDYDLVDLVEQATLEFAHEIMQTILIRNPQVSNQIRLNYQVLGGLYQNNSEGIMAIYNSILNDSRPVDWSNIFNKPQQYPPTPHLHLLNDITGFGPVVVSLERIRDAIVLSNIPAFESLIDWVKTYAGSSVFADPVVSQLGKLASQVFNIRTSNKLNGTKLYWGVVHHGTENVNFVQTSGEFTLFQNRGSFTINLSNTPPINNQSFDIEIRSDGANGPLLTMIEGIIYIGDEPYDPEEGQSLSDLITECCLYEPGVKIDASSYYVIGDKIYGK